MGHDFQALDAIIAPLQVVVDRARGVLPLVVWTKQTRYPHLRGPVVLEHYGRVGMLGEGAPDALQFYRMTPAPGDVVLEKHKYSAFVGTALDANAALQQHHPRGGHGSGRNVCVESTARQRFHA